MSTATLRVVAAVFGFLVLPLVVRTFEIPSVESVQTGDRTLAMEENTKLRRESTKRPNNALPPTEVAVRTAASQGACNFCHSQNNLADDSRHEFEVSRHLQDMARSTGVSGKSHLVAAGLTCDTCHDGLRMPAQYGTDIRLPRPTWSLETKSGRISAIRAVSTWITSTC